MGFCKFTSKSNSGLDRHLRETERHAGAGTYNEGGLVPLYLDMGIRQF